MIEWLESAGNHVSLLTASILTVFVLTPSHISYIMAMSQLRIWLDHKKLKPSGFKIRMNGQIGFEITFSGEQQAAQLTGFNGPPV